MRTLLAAMGRRGVNAEPALLDGSVPVPSEMERLPDSHGFEEMKCREVIGSQPPNVGRDG